MVTATESVPYGYGGPVLQQSVEALQGGYQQPPLQGGYQQSPLQDSYQQSTWQGSYTQSPLQETALAAASDAQSYLQPATFPPPLDMAIGSHAPAVSSFAGANLAAPVRPYGGLQVLDEDCEATNSCPAVPPWSGPQAIPSNKGKVYVQHDRDVSRFRRVHKDQIRKAYQAGAAARGSGEILQRSVPVVPASHGIAILKDPDAARLRFEDSQDVEICELIAACKQVEVNASIFFFTCQSILAGISVIAGCLVLGAGDTEQLVLVLNGLKPGVGQLILVFAEVTSVGSILRCYRAYENTLSALWSWNFTELTNLFKKHNSSMGQRFRSSAPALQAACNMVLVGYCLAGGRNDVILLLGPWLGSGGWDSQLAVDGLTAQAVLGVLCLAFALPEIFEFITKAQTDSPPPASPNAGNDSTLSAARPTSQSISLTPAILDSTLHSASSAASLR